MEVLADLEDVVGELMDTHKRKRTLWFPSDLFHEEEQESPEKTREALRERAQGIPDPARIALAIGVLTEEGLPHFHRLLAVHFGDETFWRKWNNMWTAEEDRHGLVLHDYLRDTSLLNQRTMEEMQYAYLEAGFHPSWDQDPYRVFVYTTLQERATQVTHGNTGKLAGKWEPKIQYICSRVAGDEARHYAFYRQVFAEILERDPNEALISASKIMPSIDMPGISMPHFRELSDVVRRAGIYGPRDYLKIVEDQIKFWKIEAVTGLNEAGKKAQEQILEIPGRLKRVADVLESRTKAKSFSFDLVFQREFAME